jgi:hypothetical protein
MSRRIHISVRLALLISICSLAALAEDRYLVKVAGDVNGIAIRYGLTVVRSMGGSASGHHVLSSKGPISQTVLRSLATEFSVSSAEAEKAVRLPGIKAVLRSPSRRARLRPVFPAFLSLTTTHTPPRHTSISLPPCHQYG